MTRFRQNASATQAPDQGSLPDPDGAPVGPRDPFRGARLPALLGVYFLAHVVIRLLISDTLTLDEAEQVLVSQAFQWGYSGQPPLYAWLQHLAFLILGTNLLALALVKNGLLFLAYLCFWLTARRLWPRITGLRTLATLSWFLIPQIVWEAQRDLSHSVMALTLASMSLYVLARALTPGGVERDQLRPGTVWYLTYGLVLGMGLLSKYNSLVFAGALNLALLSLPEGRTILLNPRILVAAGVALLISIPHFTWAASHWEVALRSLGKVEAAAGNNRLAGIGVLALAGVSYSTPLWLAYLGFFPHLFQPSEGRTQGVLQQTIRRYLVVLGVGLTLGVLVLGVGHVKERWMIPLLFPLPLYFFSGATLDTRDRLQGVRWFRRVALGAALLVLLAASGRALLGPRLGATTRVNYPFDRVAEALKPQVSVEVALLTHNTWFAGNLLKRLPFRSAHVPGYILPPPDPDGPVLVVWDAIRSPELPDELGEELVTVFEMDPERLSEAREVSGDDSISTAGQPPGTDLTPTYRTFPYKFGAGREARVGFILVEPSRAGEGTGQ